MSWKVAGPHVVSETFDHEIIVVNLVDGAYYSVTGSGMTFWESLQKGLSRENIIRRMVEVYEITPEAAQQAADEFARKLLENNLLEPAADTDVSDAAPGTAERSTFEPAEIQKFTDMQSAIKSDRATFTPPALQRFTDMEDVLKMDPIHDFNDLGWPNKQE